MNRKVTVLVESTQSKVIFESNATTLGELKNELRDRQVKYNSNCVFKEAISKTILTVDSSVLPSNIPWKGHTTNDLIFMITTPHKKIESGAMNRKEIYTKVKELNLQSKIQNTEGKNFTQCANALLISYIENEERNKQKTINSNCECFSNISVKEKTVSTLECLKNLLNDMVAKKIITQETANNLFGVANGKPALPVEKEPTYDELIEQFNF